MTKILVSEETWDILKLEFECLQSVESPAFVPLRLSQLKKLIVHELLDDEELMANSTESGIYHYTEKFLREMCGEYGIAYPELVWDEELVRKFLQTRQKLPGSKIEAFFSWILPRKTYADTIQQMIGDFREEYVDLIEEHSKVTVRMRYLKVLLALNCAWCTVRLLIEKALFIDKILQRITK